MKSNDEQIIKKLAGDGLNFLKKERKKLSKEIVFYQETYFPCKDRFVNLYWVEIEKKKLKFALVISPKKKPLIEITRKFGYPNKKLLVAINASNFYLSDNGRKPQIYPYNLCINNGRVLQFPSNDRITLIEKNGKISLRFLTAEGKIKIGNKYFRWIGATNYNNRKKKSLSSSEVVIWGLADIRFTYIPDSKRRAKKPITQTTYVNCPQGKLLLGVNLNKEGKPYISKKNVKKLSLLDYAFICMVKKSVGRKIKKGEIVKLVSVNNFKVKKGCNAVSLGFTLPKQFKEIKNTLVKEVRKSPEGIVRPIEKDFMKSWSVILFAGSKVIFFLVDSFPFKKNQTGLNIYELHKLLSKKFNFTEAAVCDAGQSSKICIKKNEEYQVFGNLHYIDFTGPKPKWNGINGRAITSALIAYY